MRKLAEIFGRLFRGLMGQGENLTQKAVRGAVWVVMSSGFEQLFGFVQTVILVRLLAPLDFGVFRVAAIAVAWCKMLTDTGFSEALVQRKEVNDEVLDTAWVIQIVRNLLQFLVVYLAAGAVAAFFNEPRVALMLRVIAIKFLFLAFRNPGVPLVRRAMNFKRYETFERTYNLVGTAVTLTLAFILRSYWALVIGHLVLAAVDTGGSYVLSPYRPGLRFRFRHFCELIRFGKHVYFGGILSGLSRRLDELLLGRLLGLEALGVYGVVKNLAARPMRLLAVTLRRVTFPAYSRIQDDKPKRARGFARVLGVTAFLCLPVCGGLALVAPGLVRLVLTERYHTGIVAFMIFCVGGSVTALYATMTPLFKGVGKPHLTWMAFLVAFVPFVPAVILLASAHGMEGAAAAQALRMLVMLGAAAWMTWRYVEIGFFQMMRAVGRPFFVTAIMVAVLLPAVLWAADESVLWLVVLSAGGTLIYALMTWAVNRPVLAELTAIGRSLLDERRGPPSEAVEREY